MRDGCEFEETGNRSHEKIMSRTVAGGKQT